MRAWDELIERCAWKRRRKLGGLSDEAYEELLLAVRRDPASFVDDEPEAALLRLARALDAYQSKLGDDDLLDDRAYERARARRLSTLAAECRAALELDPECLDALVVMLMAGEPDPDAVLDQLEAAELRDWGTPALDPVRMEVARSRPDHGWDCVFARPRLRLLAALSRTCLETARFRKALDYAGQAMAWDPEDHVEARHTATLALARLEDEEGFNALDARFAQEATPWTHLGRALLLAKLGRTTAARRALRGYDSLCQGGAYALLRPTFVERYLPDRPDGDPCGFTRCLCCVHEAEPVIADVPDFVHWCEGQEWFVESAHRWADAQGGW